MSETTEAPVEALPPNMTVTPRRESVNGRPEERLVVTYGTPPRTIELVELDLGAQFDLAEVTGATASSNVQWHNMAFIAASVRALDGHPVISSLSKQQLRDTLSKLGVEGMKAAGLVLGGYRGAAQAPTEEAHRSTVGNLFGTPPSQSA